MKATALLLLMSLGSFANSARSLCAVSDTPNVAAIDFRLSDQDCIRLEGGFSAIPGSFARASYSHSNLLHLGETLSLSGEESVRERQARFSLVKSALFGQPIHIGATAYGRRFSYNQDRESSIFAFQPDIPVFSQFPADGLLKYVSHGYGVTGFIEYSFRSHFSHVGLSYSYDISSFRTLTGTTYEYFAYINFQGAGFVNRLSGIRTAKLTPSFVHSTVDNPVTPAQGLYVAASTAIAGLGGDVNTVEPCVEAKYFRHGFRNGHVIALHALARVLVGYANNAAPPFDRYYAGGENDIRGFDSWSIGPIAYLPTEGTVQVYNNDGTPRTQLEIVNGVRTVVNVTMQVPVYRPISAGGDTNVITNIEYRTPLRGPFSLALFDDAGVNRASFQSDFRLSPVRTDQLNSEFPEADFSGRFPIARDTQSIRMSTGAELQLMISRIHAPLRFYWAYNPLVVRQLLEPPQTLSRPEFPNAVTYNNAIAALAAPLPLMERRFLFRFAIGRTF